MQKAMWNGTVVSYLTVMSAYNIRDPKEVQLLREADNAGELTCIECGENVSFRCGTVYMPHFSHRRGLSCKMETHTPFESEAHEECVKRLYFYFRDQGVSVEIDKRIAINRRANLYLGAEPDGVAVEVLVNAAGFRTLCGKMNDYVDHLVRNLWILRVPCLEEFMLENESFIYPVIEKTEHKTLVVLDEHMEYLTLVTRIEIRDRSQQLYNHSYIKKRYRFKDIVFSVKDNRFETDFEDYVQHRTSAFMKEQQHRLDREEAQRIEQAERKIQAELATEKRRKELEAHYLESIKRQADDKFKKKVTDDLKIQEKHISTQRNVVYEERFRPFMKILSSRNLGYEKALEFEKLIEQHNQDIKSDELCFMNMPKIIDDACKQPFLTSLELECLLRIKVKLNRYLT